MENSLNVVSDATKEAVDQELQRLWLLAQEDSQTRTLLGESGVDLAALDAFDKNPFASETKGGNRADIGTAILIGIGVKIGSDVGTKAVMALWEKLVKPQIEKRFGGLKPADDDTA